VALYLDAILTSAPGLPKDFSFCDGTGGRVSPFCLDPDRIFRRLYPAAAAVRLPVADTLREEIL
jgi:hypothetical protein